VKNSALRVFAELESLSRSAAQKIVEASVEAVSARGSFLLVLNGGGTPTRLFQLLGAEYRDQITWSKTHIFWGDERCVPPEDHESNYGQSWNILLSRVDLPASNIHRIKGELEPSEAANDYALILKQFASTPLDWPRFDLVLLGMGDDGHTASLFPGSEVNVSAPIIAVTAQYENRPASRLTLTPLVFNSARRIIFLVSGKSKSQTLASVLYGEYQPENLPAQRIRPTDGDLIWMVDQLAASKL